MHIHVHCPFESEKCLPLQLLVDYCENCQLSSIQFTTEAGTCIGLCKKPCNITGHACVVLLRRYATYRTV